MANTLPPVAPRQAQRLPSTPLYATSDAGWAHTPHVTAFRSSRCFASHFIHSSEFCSWGRSSVSLHSSYLIVCNETLGLAHYHIVLEIIGEKSELMFKKNSCICTCIVSASHIIAYKITGLPRSFTKISRTFQNQTHFPGVSRAWKFNKKKPRTFQEAWEPCEGLVGKEIV